jgi:hypothetical protein
MVKNRLTDRKLRSLRGKSTRYDVMDSDVPALASRIRKRTTHLHSGWPLSRQL